LDVSGSRPTHSNELLVRCAALSISVNVMV